jgi:hypothetical protein
MTFQFIHPKTMLQSEQGREKTPSPKRLNGITKKTFFFPSFSYHTTPEAGLFQIGVASDPEASYSSSRRFEKSPAWDPKRSYPCLNNICH